MHKPRDRARKHEGAMVVAAGTGRLQLNNRMFYPVSLTKIKILHRHPHTWNNQNGAVPLIETRALEREMGEMGEIRHGVDGGGGPFGFDMYSLLRIPWRLKDSGSRGCRYDLLGIYSTEQNEG